MALRHFKLNTFCARLLIPPRTDYQTYSSICILDANHQHLSPISQPKNLGALFSHLLPVSLQSLLTVSDSETALPNLREALEIRQCPSVTPSPLSLCPAQGQLWIRNLGDGKPREEGCRLRTLPLGCTPRLGDVVGQRAACSQAQTHHLVACLGLDLLYIQRKQNGSCF